MFAWKCLLTWSVCTCCTCGVQKNIGDTPVETVCTVFSPTCDDRTGIWPGTQKESSQIIVRNSLLVKLGRASSIVKKICTLRCHTAIIFDRDIHYVVLVSEAPQRLRRL
eukprot:8067376-Pyramimonas_sp.AAC.1